jgi:signal transduction histidine kinase
VPRPRLASGVAIAALLAALGLAAQETQLLTTLRTDWEAWSAIERDARAQRVARGITETARRLAETAEALASDSVRVQQWLAGSASGDGAGAWDAPPAPPALSMEAATLVFRRGVLLAHGGQVHSQIAPVGAPGASLIDGPFHTTLVVRRHAADGELEIVTTALLASAPPADRFARSLVQTLGDGIDGAHTAIESPDSANVAEGETVMVVPDGTRRLARVRATTVTQGEALLVLEQEARGRTAVLLVLAFMAFFMVAWRAPASPPARLAAVGVGLLAVIGSPLSALSNVSPLFDPSSYFSQLGGAFTSSIAALLLTALLALALTMSARRPSRRGPGGAVRTLAALLVLWSGPLVLSRLAEGIAWPATGADVGLWMAWQLALALVGAALMLAAASVAPPIRLPVGRVGAIVPGVAIALVAGALAPVLLAPSGRWPAWYPLLWAVALSLFPLSRRGVGPVVAAALVAGSGAATLTWGATVRARLALAEQDLQRVTVVDENALVLLERFAGSLFGAPPPVVQPAALLQRYAASDLARAGYPARLARWSPDDFRQPRAVLELAPVADTIGAQGYLALLARQSGTLEVRRVADGPTSVLMAAVPASDGTVTTIAVPPRTRLLPADPFAAFTGVAGVREPPPPYGLTLTAAAATDTVTSRLAWTRRGTTLHGDGVIGDAQVMRRVHAQVELRPLDALLSRGLLFLVVDVLVVLGLWVITALPGGALQRLLRYRRRRWSRSYRLRLTAALLAFFLAPAALFGGWTWYRLQDEDRASRILLIRETLRVAAAEQEQRRVGSAPSSTGAPLFLYLRGQLLVASDPLLDALAPLGRLLPASLTGEFSRDEEFTSRRVTAGASRPLVGYRHLAPSVTADPEEIVLATPARGDDDTLDTRRADLGVLAFVSTLLGALAALWLSGVAARSLSRPVGALRRAALALAGGQSTPTLGEEPATEFVPVYAAFRRLVDDLASSRAALEAAQRRTAAVLQHVATGVLAVLPSGEIVLANPRAVDLLGEAACRPGARLDALATVDASLAARIRAFLDGPADDDAWAWTLAGRQLRARLTRFSTGAVLTLDDVTDLATAQRVLAWGEMARQVAHEIKNPLTPMRLGVQHLRRAYRDGRSDFGGILETNVPRILEAIDHLDAIARAFSTYGAVPAERAPAEPVDVARVLEAVVALEQLGVGDEGPEVEWRLAVPPGPPPVAWARTDELRDVVLNLLENARQAQARTVTVRASQQDTVVVITVTDDGVGMSPEVLPRIFEPQFSTRTSGSGLGLAISRRLIDGWGGTIHATSTTGIGTTMTVQLRSAGTDEVAAR